MEGRRHHGWDRLGYSRGRPIAGDPHRLVRVRRTRESRWRLHQMRWGPGQRLEKPQAYVWLARPPATLWGSLAWQRLLGSHPGSHVARALWSQSGGGIYVG